LAGGQPAVDHEPAIDVAAEEFDAEAENGIGEEKAQRDLAVEGLPASKPEQECEDE
jgi:hypothetical protein